MMKMRQELKLPLDLPRCCYDTMIKDAPRDPTEGVEVPCNHCMDHMRFTNGAWVWVLWRWHGDQEKIEP